jgi:GTPase
VRRRWSGRCVDHQGTIGGMTSPRRSRDVPGLVSAAREGDPRAVARLVSLVEDGDPALPEIAAALAPYTGQAQVVGLTGSPGVGKSTLTNELVRAYRGEGKRVGVLAIDPSSPFTGGAILGDRVRMQDHAVDPGVYIRSMSSRGHLGGLSAATPQAVRVLEGAGCEVVLVETVGVGQAEVDVASLADTTLVLLAPGMGDAIQAVKAGILEIADVFVVNKADRDGARQLAQDLLQMLHLGEATPWQVPVVLTAAAKGEGVGDLVAAIERHGRHLAESGEGAARRRLRAAREIEALALATFRQDLAAATGGLLDDLAERVADGGIGPHAAADKLVEELRHRG